MNAFDPDFLTAVNKRVVRLVPLITIKLPLDIYGNQPPIGYISDRTITVGGATYVKKLLAWQGIQQDITGGNSSASFTFSNVDRVFSLAAELFLFLHAEVTFSVYSNDSNLSRIYWIGYISTIESDLKTFKINCKDGLYSLSLPLPRRRVTRMCDWKFDDGCYCPYSSFGSTGSGTGTTTTVPDLAGIASECAQELINITPAEGFNSYPGFTDCDKTFNDCKLRGMWRFFSGVRFISSWAGSYQRGFFSRTFGSSGSLHESFSISNDSAYNLGVPLVYTTIGYFQTPLLFQWRPENDYLAAEGIIGSGFIGTSINSGFDNNTNGLGDVYLNGLAPHSGQHPTTANFGVVRSAGRIGETLGWDVIGGDLQGTDTPGDPPVFFNNISGVFIRVKDKDAGINNPTYTAGNSTANYSDNTPVIQIEVLIGRLTWIYSTGNDPGSANNVPSAFTRTRAPASNPAQVIADLVFEALDSEYASMDTHLAALDMTSICFASSYCDAQITSVVDGSTVNRYIFSGQVSDLRPAVDQIDSVLQDMYGYRFWRNGAMVISPYVAGALDTAARPGFAENVNIVYGSFQCNTVEPKFNELQLNFGDSAYGYQLNTASVYSEAHQLVLGLNGHRSILSQSYNLTGTCTMDQAVREGSSWLKDEIGGSNQSEWQQYREIIFKTGFFMAELEIGDVTFVTHSLIPGGGDWFRVTKWELSSADWSLTFTMRSFRIGNYNDQGAPS